MLLFQKSKLCKKANVKKVLKYHHNALSKQKLTAKYNFLKRCKTIFLVLANTFQIKPLAAQLEQAWDSLCIFN